MWSWSTVPGTVPGMWVLVGVLGVPLGRTQDPSSPSLTCRCCRCAFPGRGSGRACTRVGCRTRCNGAGPAASAWSRPPGCTQAGEGGGIEWARPWGALPSGDGLTFILTSLATCEAPPGFPEHQTPPPGCHLSLRDPPLDPSPDIRRRRSESPPRRVHSSALDPMTLRAPHCRLQEGEVKDALPAPPEPAACGAL